MAIMLFGTAQSEEAPLKGIKLGFGFDRGFGLTGSIGKINGFLGNDGIAIDYIFMKDKLNVEVDAPVSWYIGAGGFGDWDGDFGLRVPVGVEVGFAKRVDAYAHIIPRLRFNNNNNNSNDNADFGLSFGIGVRYQF